MRATEPILSTNPVIYLRDPGVYLSQVSVPDGPGMEKTACRVCFDFLYARH